MPNPPPRSLAPSELASGNRAERLTGKTAVVTGATSGIGRAVAHELAFQGARVMVHGRDAARAQVVCAELTERFDADTTSLLADLCEPEARQRLIDTAWAWQSGVDIWVNVAGADVLTGAAGDWDFAQKLDTLWAVDVRATILLSREVGRRMFEQHSQQSPAVIIHTGWDQAETGMAGDPGELFGPIKAAIMAFSKSQAQTLAPRVRVNCVAPGWIRTAWSGEASEYWQHRAAKESLRDRWGTPEDVAKVVGFIASDDADFLDGQVIPVNGGFRYGLS
jgi:3-oxoacyl-[acyl-carrier protein] reductase